MATFAYKKQVTWQTAQEIRFIVHSLDEDDHRAVEVCRWQTSLNTGKMQQQTSRFHHLSTARSIQDSLCKDGYKLLDAVF